MKKYLEVYIILLLSIAHRSQKNTTVWNQNMKHYKLRKRLTVIRSLGYFGHGKDNVSHCHLFPYINLNKLQLDSTYLNGHYITFDDNA